MLMFPDVQVPEASALIDETLISLVASSSSTRESETLALGSAVPLTVTEVRTRSPLEGEEITPVGAIVSFINCTGWLVAVLPSRSVEVATKVTGPSANPPMLVKALQIISA